MRNYQRLIEKILDIGVIRKNRTGVDTLAIFFEQLNFDLECGFPLVTCKKVNFKNVTAELAGFLHAAKYVTTFQELGTHIWDANAEAFGQDGYLGPIYGTQWREWSNPDETTIDQLRQVVKALKEDPYSRRMLVTAWNPSDLPDMALPPCHTHMQFIRHGHYLHCCFYMRSVDVFLGLPYDIALYALLTHIIANQVELTPGRLTAFLADTHLYTNHVAQAEKLIELPCFPLPTLILQSHATIDNFMPNMATLTDYQHGPYLKGAMAV